MLDQDTVQAILERHFAGAQAAAVRHATQEILLLELLADDRMDIEWEDRLHDPASRALTVFMTGSVRRGA